MGSEEIRVEFCIDNAWLRGYCFATERKRAGVLSGVRAVLQEACEDITDCSFRVVHVQKGWPMNEYWDARATHPGLEAPLGCHVRRLNRAVKHVMRRELQRWVRGK